MDLDFGSGFDLTRMVMVWWRTSGAMAGGAGCLDLGEEDAKGT